jgi:hypothetical protein
MGKEDSKDMDKEEVKTYSKVAKGKSMFTTQLPDDLIEKLKEYSDEVGLPMTIILDKFLGYCLVKAKETGTIPLTPDSGVWE